MTYWTGLSQKGLRVKGAQQRVAASVCSDGGGGAGEATVPLAAVTFRATGQLNGVIFADTEQ